MSDSSPTQAPLVSVIIPTYDRFEYLRVAIESVLQQTYPHLEIIVADDCSPQNPQALIDSFHDPRLTLHRHATNLGNGPNIANAFLLAQGKYVASLNDDDYWHPNFIATLIQPLEANLDVAVAFCDHYIVNADGRLDLAASDENSHRWGRDRLEEGVHRPFIEQALVHQSVSPASSALLRRDAIAWPELLSVGVYWDYFLAYLSCRQGLGAYYCPERLTYYRIHNQSETNLSGGKDARAKIRKGRSGVYCYSQFLADPNLQAFLPYFRQRWVEANTTLALGLIKAGTPTEARPYLQKALRQSPNPRTLAALLISFLPDRAMQLLGG
jgi:glycosyltransferase involved in cell wall biosynthesis